jgi:twitching motility two-component system response regulator PilH
MAIQKILVVDDNSTDLIYLEQICSNAGYNVVTATSGAEAIAKVKSEMPDAVLLDIVMSDLNGFQVCRAITSDANTQHIPVLLISSKGEKADRIWGEQQGAKAYITKPCTADQLLTQLRAL